MICQYLWQPGSKLRDLSWEMGWHSAMAWPRGGFYSIQHSYYAYLSWVWSKRHLVVNRKTEFSFQWDEEVAENLEQRRVFQNCYSEDILTKAANSAWLIAQFHLPYPCILIPHWFLFFPPVVSSIDFFLSFSSAPTSICLLTSPVLSPSCPILQVWLLQSRTSMSLWCYWHESQLGRISQSKVFKIFFPPDSLSQFLMDTEKSSGCWRQRGGDREKAPFPQ